MGIMTVQSVWTRADLDALPDDGRRHEILDGLLIMTPAPEIRHQVVLSRLNSRLVDASPAGLLVLFAPVDVVLAPDTVLQPDLVVAGEADFSDKDLPVPPLMVVEILAPSTRLYDLNLKRARFEQAGVQAYWVVDPTTGWLSAWRLVDGRYELMAEVDGNTDFVADFPFPVTITAADRRHGPTPTSAIGRERCYNTSLAQ